MITVTAPGKLMLMGDHAVVYGYPCITTAIDERLSVCIEKTNDGKVTVVAPQAHDTRFVDGAVDRALKVWKIPNIGFRLTTRCGFSGTYGFGSSSAVSVATLKALAAISKKDISDKEIFDTAFNVVLSIQGVGSGFDVASAVFGGTTYYVKGGKVIEQLRVSNMPLVVGYTGVKSSTVDLVNAVAKKREQYPEKVDRIFQGITKLVDEAKVRMEDGDWERVGRLMDFNQEYLCDLGVSSEKLESLVMAAKGAGAWGAKLSGAGGGDCMVALVSPDKRKAIEDAITNAGGEVVHVSPNAPGVRLETTDNQEEMFIVVDKNDNILGYRTRYECHHDKSLIHRTVGVLIFNKKGQLLLQKRSETKDMDPGMWAISTAGHVEKGQSYEEAARRELKEELCIDVGLMSVVKFLSETDEETEMAMLYKGISDGPFVFDPKETSEVNFFDMKEIRSMQLSYSSLQTLQKAGLL